MESVMNTLSESTYLYISENITLYTLVACIFNLFIKTEYLTHIKNLKQAVNHVLVFEKVDRVIRFNKKSWIKLYIDINTDLKKAAKNDSEKGFLKLMNNSALGITM